MLDHMRIITKELIVIYEDSDHSLKNEIDFLHGLGQDKDIYTIFYDQLKDLENFYSNDAQLAEEITSFESKDHRVPITFAYPHFSGEEGYGQYLDLHALHLQYINSKFGSSCDYFEYLKDSAWALNKIEEKYRNSTEYRSYLSSMVRYLEDFYTRSKPLASLEKIYCHNNSKVEIEYSEEEFSSQKKTSDFSSSTIDLAAYSSLEQLESLGGDKLKKKMLSLGLKCGGKVHERACRLWSIRHIPIDQVDRSLIARKTKTLKRKSKLKQEVKINEAKISKLSVELQEIIQNTLAKIENKLTKTYQEIDDENIDENIDDISSIPLDKEDHDYIYNPLKLPAGPDGKPIPYWLYKLHGLNRKIECEICGNFVYEGRRAFEKHFEESRHRQGMQALGIPNSRTFFEITSINDAINLWNSVKPSKNERVCGVTKQEVEDEDGNVYDKETYDLLKKQGIL
jgi:splicing factor 3A subunit 3